MIRLGITANRLTDGRVVYAREDGSWSPALSEAALFDDAAAAEPALNAALRDILTVVAPYTIEVEEGLPGGRARVREAIRLSGPSAGTTRHAANEA
ncbi:DUF2849 domain-containing protein [Marinicauda algicola]|uniref:DUF2849 domain-containing protein n=1 Tax=Marinicauda algicola TaxID=2029849 RepID=A0A4S2GX49_9PROT|nr:DUF2849 domain-containing protein [Marinicauda algicola]TGY87614.1 DUF2849 domain-containing protein [Marinicauda algicola]